METLKETSDPQTTAQPAAPAARPAAARGHWLLGIAGLAAVALAASLAAVAWSRHEHAKELAEAAARTANSPPIVTVASVRLAPSTSELTLPGNAQAFRGAALYARTNGYIKRWLVDIGDRVTEGQLLAEISAPDVDEQLDQARANLDLAKANLRISEANLELAKTTLDRDTRAGPGTGTTLLQLDQDRALVKTTAAQVESARASIQVNEATVRQYAVLQSFQKIVAPFAGVITSRNIDPGVLVTADNPSETRPLFYVMQTDPLRVFINVPQAYATSIKPGQQATMYREEEPQKKFSGRVTRTANSLDPNTRTLLTQVDVPNPDDALRPGMYLQVTFRAARAGRTVLIPSAAIITRNDGSEVAVLDDKKKVRYRGVELGRDFGIEVEVLKGLADGETVIVHPGDALPPGQEVEPAPAAK